MRHRRTEPVFGPVVRNVSPCAFWPVRPAEPPTEVANDRPALLVTATRDARATDDQALALRRLLTGSRLVSLDARKHGLFGEYGNDCVDRTVTAYLTSARLPATDLRCH